VVVNNAGTFTGGSLLTQPADEIQEMFSTNVFGALNVARAFAPVLERNGGGALLNVHSILSWTVFPGGGAYAATKAAFWALTNALRLELAPRGTLVTGLHLGYTDTPMIESFDVDKNDPANVVRVALDGLRDGRYEVIADEMTDRVRHLLSEPLRFDGSVRSGGFCWASCSRPRTRFDLGIRCDPGGTRGSPEGPRSLRAPSAPAGLRTLGTRRAPGRRFRRPPRRSGR